MPLATCQAVGCINPIKRGQFLCTAHWHGLPLPLRRQVNDTWSRRRRAMSDKRAIIDHVEACDEARRFIAEGEGRLEAYR
ncbi:MAG TPA: hypothetical protein VGR74_05870, partial [Actinomycetota bacterium]|nr:hypothetical protein [Actinomycetota bacterium]